MADATLFQSIRTDVLPKVDAADLHRMMDEISAFGGGRDGSMNRLSLSQADRDARDWLAAFCAEEGLTLLVDGMGNMFGLLNWAGPQAPTIMTGSHLDSQPNGGRFDGAYGVVAACAAVRALKKEVVGTGIRPLVNIALVNWTNEEGARFQPSLLGSGVYAGEHTLEFAWQRRDDAGVSVMAALDAIGYRGSHAPPAADAYIELHIEGSSKLEQAKMRFAAFTHYWGAVKYRLAFIGRQSHTGPTPMAERRDALLAAAYLVADLKAMADAAGSDLHTSVGRLEISPNSPNVVPGKAVGFIELRSSSMDVLTRAEGDMRLAIRRAAERAGVTFEVEAVDRRRAGPMDAGLVRLAVDAAHHHGQPTLMLETIGGHDAVSMAPVCPSIVIAVPSVGGVMHDPAEFTSEADRELGASILAGMLWRFCLEGDVIIKDPRR
jgi:N-carbamoyl-L-amino-acid hydrolase